MSDEIDQSKWDDWTPLSDELPPIGGIVTLIWNPIDGGLPSWIDAYRDGTEAEGGDWEWIAADDGRPCRWNRQPDAWSPSIRAARGYYEPSDQGEPPQTGAHHEH